MPVLIAFVLYLLGCMLLSALLAPWFQPLFETYLNAPPGRSLYRFAMLLGALGLPLLLRWLQLRGRTSLGFARPANGPWSAIGQGLLFGILILTGSVIGLISFGARYDDPQVDFALGLLARTAVAGLASGLLVGLIEEFFFRGPMHTGARRHLPFWPTAILTGLFYSAVHFIRPAEFTGNTFDIASALDMTLTGIAQLGDLGDHADRFMALLVAGIFLSMVRERTGNIFWAIGIHAGWVMTIKVAKRFSESNHEAEMAWLMSSDSITGWWSAIWMAGIAAIYWWWTSPERHRR